jgi:hypothetical protein
MDAIQASGLQVRTRHPPSLWCMPTLKIIPRPKYRLACSVNPETFMNWEPEELRTVRVGTSRKKRNKSSRKIVWKDYQIPAPYDRIVAQFILEDEHAELHRGHEAVRRQSYVNEVLDMFAEEIIGYDGLDAAFRSKVLTPILQRHLWGVHDAYGPSVRGAILNGDEGKVTIGMATQFYLSDDPTDPMLIPTYRRNIIYNPEVRWHLGIIMDKKTVGGELSYNNTRVNHDIVMDSLQEEDGGAGDMEGPPKFSKLEVDTIVVERLEAFFDWELELVV